MAQQRRSSELRLESPATSCYSKPPNFDNSFPASPSYNYPEIKAMPYYQPPLPEINYSPAPANPSIYQNEWCSDQNSSGAYSGNTSDRSNEWYSPERKHEFLQQEGFADYCYKLANHVPQRQLFHCV